MFLLKGKGVPAIGINSDSLISVLTDIFIFLDRLEVREQSVDTHQVRSKI